MNVGPLKELSAQKLARGMGWFSIGLGLAELLAPRAVAKACGLQGRSTGLMRAYGLREIATGLLIFGQGRRPALGMWCRVAGDAVDLATLGAASALPTTNKVGVAIGAANVMGVTAVDLMCAKELSRQQGKMTEDGALRVQKSITIRRTPDEVYAFWRDFENLPSFMYHVESVQILTPQRSHWVVRAPAGTNVEWDAELGADEPGAFLAWQSLRSSAVRHKGSVRFERAPANRGTIVRVDLQYSLPGSIAGAAFAMLFNRSPRQQIADDLRRLKQVMETGEVVRSDGSPRGTGSVLQRPARPLADAVSVGVR